jgi:hypothetical protein
MEYNQLSGHANFFFPEGARSFVAIRCPIRVGRCSYTLREGFRQARDPLNHPALRFLSVGMSISRRSPTIWWRSGNGPMKPFRASGDRLVALTAVRRRRLARIGGSDTHRIERFASAWTRLYFVQCRSPSVNDNLEALRTGHSIHYRNNYSPRPVSCVRRGRSGRCGGGWGTATVTVNNAKAGMCCLSRMQGIDPEIGSLRTQGSFLPVRDRAGRSVLRRNCIDRVSDEKLLCADQRHVCGGVGSTRGRVSCRHLP